MSLTIPELIVPPDEILSILKERDMPVDTQPTPIGDELLGRIVALATVHEESSGNLHSVVPVQIGQVATISSETGHVHLGPRVKPDITDVALIVPETYHTPVALDPESPNWTTLLPVRALFYVLARPRRIA